MGERVHSYLVTGTDDGRRSMQVATAAVANWLDTRQRTTLVTCFDEDSEGFLRSARSLGLTVEEIVHGAAGETYKLLVGEPGTGWEASGDV